MVNNIINYLISEYKRAHSEYVKYDTLYKNSADPSQYIIARMNEAFGEYLAYEMTLRYITKFEGNIDELIEKGTYEN